MSVRLVGVHFEVWGRVQGVFFRKYTRSKATELGLVGWVRNTRDGSVQGEVEGPSAAVAEMQGWLEKTGSPASRVDRAAFSTPKPLDKLSFSAFQIRK